MKSNILISDDDGIVMIVSANSLKKRYTNQSFDYYFPNALVEGMNAKELVCVSTDGGGLIEIVVEQNPRDETEVMMSALHKSGWTVFPPLQLKIGRKDELLVLPYSQYTFAADMSKGEVDVIEGLSSRNQIEEGLYDVYFAHLLELEDLIGDNDDNREFPDRLVRFILVPANYVREVQVDGVPGISYT